ncbi:MAG: hypothetical protein NVS2B6_07830 [Thermoleophilaceae bacterium]
MRRPQLSLSRASTAAAAREAGGRPRLRRPRGGQIVVACLLALIVVAGFWIRLRHIGYGLPYVYNYDEANHFTDHSVLMFGGDLNPQYFQNPTGFTYLVLGALHLVYGVLGVGLAQGSVTHQFAADPTPIFKLARFMTTLLAMGGVVATFLVGRRVFGSRVVLVAAAVLTTAFLPVTYSRIAVTDVGTFMPVVVALYAAMRVLEDGRRSHYLLGGAAVGLACCFKYTAGLAIVPLVVAAGIRFRRDRGISPLRRRDLRLLIAAGLVLVACFAVTSPYFFVHLHNALYQLNTQARAAGGSEKIGQTQQGGFSYYLESMNWGFGLAAALLAVVGGFVQLRRDRARGAVLLVFPVLLFLYMGIQSRYFGRWLLSIYPVLALLAGVGLVGLVEGLMGRFGTRVAGGRRLVAGVVIAALCVGVVAQPVAADLRTANVLGRTDTRQLAREYLTAHYAPSLRAVIEPAVSANFYKRGSLPNRSRQFVRGVVRDLRRRAHINAPEGADTTYAATLAPALIDVYRQLGYCTIATMSVIRGRVETRSRPKGLAYYRRIEGEARLLKTISPFKPGRPPVPLHFDFSYDYYPTAYMRPGPIIDIYRLGDCKQGYGRVPGAPTGNDGLNKGASTSAAADNIGQ